MRIIITDLESGEVNIQFEKNLNDEKGPTFPEVYARLMAAMEGSVNSFLNNVEVPNKERFRESLFDILDTGFGNFLYKVFPEVNPGEFDLTDAAIVYAQDQIISKAEAEGKTYKEMLEEYEAMADAYIDDKRKN